MNNLLKKSKSFHSFLTKEIEKRDYVYSGRSKNWQETERGITHILVTQGLRDTLFELEQYLFYSEIKENT